MLSARGGEKGRLEGKKEEVKGWVRGLGECSQIMATFKAFLSHLKIVLEIEIAEQMPFANRCLFCSGSYSLGPQLVAPAGPCQALRQAWPHKRVLSSSRSAHPPRPASGPEPESERSMAPEHRETSHRLREWQDLSQRRPQDLGGHL